MAGQPCCGQIVWADIADANGIYKARPAVVITPDVRVMAFLKFAMTLMELRNEAQHKRQ
jgi:hypothetical protein